MMLAPHSACRVETRRAECAMCAAELVCAAPSQQRLRRTVAAPSQHRCAQHQLRRSSISSVADATRRMSATELVCAAPSRSQIKSLSFFGGVSLYKYVYSGYCVTVQVYILKTNGGRTNMYFYRMSM